MGKRLYTSTLSVAQLISVFQKKKTNDEALTENGVDIEDNVQFVLARKQKCRVIITNNYKDYRLLLGAQIIKPSK